MDMGGLYYEVTYLGTKEYPEAVAFLPTGPAPLESLFQGSIWEFSYPHTCLKPGSLLWGRSSPLTEASGGRKGEGAPSLPARSAESTLAITEVAYAAVSSVLTSQLHFEMSAGRCHRNLKMRAPL